MERLIFIRNRSARAIRNILGYINREDFSDQPAIGLKNRLEHLEKQWKNFVTKNTKLTEQAPTKREQKKHWKLYDDIEFDYLSVREILKDQIQRKKIVHQENEEIPNDELSKK